MKKSTLISALLLSACGTVTVQDQNNGIKRIEFTDPPFIAFPREAAFAHPDVQSVMKTKALQNCNYGYNTLNEKYIKDNGQGKDALVWEIRCKGS